MRSAGQLFRGRATRMLQVPLEARDRGGWQKEMNMSCRRRRCSFGRGCGRDAVALGGGGGKVRWREVGWRTASTARTAFSIPASPQEIQAQLARHLSSTRRHSTTSTPDDEIAELYRLDQLRL